MKIRQRRNYLYLMRGGPHRCKEYYPGCLNCEYFKFLGEHGRFPKYEEVRDTVEMLANPRRDQ